MPREAKGKNEEKITDVDNRKTAISSFFEREDSRRIPCMLRIAIVTVVVHILASSI